MVRIQREILQSRSIRRIGTGRRTGRRGVPRGFAGGPSVFRKKGPRRAASTRKETPASDAHHCLGHTDMASETEALLTSPGRAVARHRAMVAIVVAVLCATAFALVASAGGESAARAFARLGVSGARVRSSHVDGRTPTVFVAETEDPSREDWFEPLKATILATADLPELIGRLEPVESVRATDLPTRIELYEEAAQGISRTGSRLSWESTSDDDTRTRTPTSTLSSP